MSISLSGLTRREARYIRVRLLYSEQNHYQLPVNQNEMEDKQNDLNVQYNINRILILGMPTKPTTAIRNLVLLLQK